jgi:excisionase family DNA binding protein
MFTDSQNKSDDRGPEAEVISYADAARALGININTLYAWVHQKRVPHVRYGRRNVRFRRADLQAFLASHAVPAKAEVEP